jgi:hypothetical protein
VFLYASLADTTVILAPGGLLTQASGSVGMAVGGLAYGIGDAGIFFGLCH